MDTYKPILHYGVRESLAPGETNPTVVPVIIDRQQPVDLETIVENCIDRGLIAGIKPTAAHGIAEGIAEQIYKEFTSGNGVAFGQYFYGRLYLDGTVNANGTLSDANKVNVRLYKGNLFKLSRDGFTMQFDGDATAPKITNIVNAENGTRGEVVHGGSVTVNGENLNAAGDTNSVKFVELGAEGTAQVVTVSAFTAVGPSILTFDCPASLVSGKSYSVTASRTDTNGVTRTTAAKTVVVSGEAPAPGPSFTLTGINAPGQQSPLIEIDNSIEIHGTGLGAFNPDGVDTIKAKDVIGEGNWFDITDMIEGEPSATRIDLGSVVWSTLTEHGIDGSHNEVSFQVTIGGESHEIDARIVID